MFIENSYNFRARLSITSCKRMNPQMNPVIVFLIVYPEIILCALLCLASAFWIMLGRAGRAKAELLLIASVFGFVGPIFATVILQSLATIRPLRFDYYVFKIDGVLGFEPSFFIGTLFYKCEWLHIIAGFGYDVLSAVYVGVFAIYLVRRSIREVAEVASAFSVNLFASLPIYLLFPVCGPRYAFSGFPFSAPQHLTAHAVPLFAPPNGVPSVHTSSALLILWFLRRWPAGRIFGCIFLCITIIATLGTGEHYLFDLLMAVPYALGVAWAARSISARVTVAGNHKGADLHRSASLEAA